MQNLRTSTRRLATLAALASAAVLGAATATVAPASAAPTWAPADQATLTPGVQAYTEGGQCTANFVFTDSAGGVYLGYAAHCAGTGEATQTDGCESGSLPLGTKVDFAEGGSLVTVTTEVTGPGADGVGAMVTADAPTALAALVAQAEAEPEPVPVIP